MKRVSTAVIALMAVWLAACGGSGGTTNAITVSDAWVNGSIMAGMPSAAYFVIQNNGAAEDKLLSVEGDIAQMIQIHETKDSGGGMMSMSPVANVSIPAGSKVEFKPGGFHVMVMGLTRELKTGDKVQLTLNFEKAGKVPVTAEVREQ